MRINASAATPGESHGSPKQMEDDMPEIDGQDEIQIREIAYFLWLNEGCPEGRADDHWTLACGMLSASVPAADEPQATTAAPVRDALADTPVAMDTQAKP
jgi:hypothetical protein